MKEHFPLFDSPREPVPIPDRPGTYVLPGFAADSQLPALVEKVLTESPLRHYQTPMGRPMRVASSNCGRVGWTSDRRGYRYAALDPETGRRWPAIPLPLAKLATAAAQATGYPGFCPDACLINQYRPDVGMGSHQDRDEGDYLQPVVSISFGVSARFFMQRGRRAGRSVAIDLHHGDVLVFGGQSRLYFHGVRPLKTQWHPLLGDRRLNLTFRQLSEDRLKQAGGKG